MKRRQSDIKSSVLGNGEWGDGGRGGFFFFSGATDQTTQTRCLDM